jgi:hypothetical protein
MPDAVIAFKDIVNIGIMFSTKLLTFTMLIKMESKIDTSPTVVGNNFDVDASRLVPAIHPRV